MVVEVKINGSAQTCRSGETLQELIEFYCGGKVGGSESGSGLAVALNGAVVRRADWPTVRIASGDELELVRATQGG